MVAGLKISRVEIKGVKRLIARTNRIEKSIKSMATNDPEKFMNDIKEEAQSIIYSNTHGTGRLAQSLFVKKVPTKKGATFSVEVDESDNEVQYYAYKVHEGLYHPNKPIAFNKSKTPTEWKQYGLPTNKLIWPNPSWGGRGLKFLEIPAKKNLPRAFKHLATRMKDIIDFA